LAIDQECKTLLSGSRDRSVKWWHLETGKEIRTINTGSAVLTLDICNNNLYAGLQDSTIKVYDLYYGKLNRTLGGHKQPVRSLKVSANC